ncbi:DUF5985 family protein [Bradyrhizobium amphicarpaeae]|uniref:Uncharacterized protein n=1 Tax=Bradyrhizobium amphicarpaeae TaxID=1404768 RepID=A0A2U8PU50_9BRAD|nr:DUF5985 family protein [Bradyrhizobium amphicarpaeae]AWM01333.1 hypothetical protein CIT40_15670 [Bradyrhizobium amphicarpaeae]
MTNNLSAVLSGAVAMASFATTLFFAKFWRQTSDVFFLLFALAFAIDTVSRVALGLTETSYELEPAFYVLRLAMFALIIVAITLKNRSR